MYQQVKEYWKNLIEEQLYQIAQEKGIEAFLVREAGELAVNTTQVPIWAIWLFLCSPSRRF